MAKASPFERQLRSAERFLQRSDPKLKELISKSGRCRIEKSTRFKPFEALLSAITHQQLHGKAAKTILGRVIGTFGENGFPKPEVMAKARMPALRACGLSRAKALAIVDLAKRTLDGTVPPARTLHTLGDDDILERLTTVRGVGPWTVQMMLLFDLGRLDVLPVEDFGVRKGFSLVYGHDPMATKKQLAAHAEAWKPFRGVASWYMWRALE